MMQEPRTIEDGIWALWLRCLTSAQEMGQAPANAVQRLIVASREIAEEMGYSKRDSDLILFGVYTNIHWDWKHPTARMFETLLEFELYEFFAERMLNKLEIN
jgi:hypothetical protein